MQIFLKAFNVLDSRIDEAIHTEVFMQPAATKFMLFSGTVLVETESFFISSVPSHFDDVENTYNEPNKDQTEFIF